MKSMLRQKVDSSLILELAIYFIKIELSAFLWQGLSVPLILYLYAKQTENNVESAG